MFGDGKMEKWKNFGTFALNIPKTVSKELKIQIQSQFLRIKNETSESLTCDHNSLLIFLPNP